MVRVQTLLPMSSVTGSSELASNRWLLSQLSASLGHHIVYTCKVKRHGVILYRRGSEVEALSYALHQLSKVNQDTKVPEVDEDLHRRVLVSVNKKIHAMVSNSLANPNFADLNAQADPLVWETISTLTRSTSDKQSTSSSSSRSIKDMRRAFILSQVMYCIDNRASVPFQLMLADIIDCYGGSTQLIKVLNRLGVCTSSDTLQRHILATVVESETKGVLQGLHPSVLTVVSMDNIDFLQSYAQGYCGNQHLSWHGTTVQAIQTKPSLKESTPLPENNPHDVHSSVHVAEQPARKRSRCRARTSSELGLNAQANATDEHSQAYNFDPVSTLPPKAQVSIEHFRVSPDEQKSCSVLKIYSFTVYSNNSTRTTIKTG